MAEDFGAYPGLPTLTVHALSHRVCESLRGAIVDGVLYPGQRLVEAAIAQRLGVSRAPVREAIRVLEREGLVRSLPRRGIVVAVLDRRDVREIYGLRTALECWAVREVCSRATATDVEGLRSLVLQMEEASSQDGKQFLVTQDVSFHREICEISGNARLLETWMAMMSQVRLLSRQVISTLYPDLNRIPQRHGAILLAIESRDAGKAERCMRDHIESVAGRILSAFPAPESDDGIAARAPRGPHGLEVHRAGIGVE